MKPPDIVAEAHHLYARQYTPQRYDMLKRERLSAAIYAMELQWNQHPLPMQARLILVSRKLGLWMSVAFCAASLFVEPLLRIYGRGLCSPVTYPIVFALSAAFGIARFATTASIREAVWRFFLPQGFFVIFEWCLSPGISPHWKVFPIILSAAFIGYLADQINTHCLRLVTASIFMDSAETKERRGIWDRRFNWFDLRKEISEVKNAIEFEPNQDAVQSLKQRLTDLERASRYPFAFLGLCYATALVLFDASPIVVLASSALSAILVLPKFPPSVKAAKFFLAVALQSMVSWLSWETQQHWVHSPGMFRDDLYSRFRRVTQIVACVVLVQMTFVPPIYPWGAEVALTPSSLWKMSLDLFIKWIFPALLLISVLMATSARSIWMSAEDAERSTQNHESQSGELLLG